MYLHHFHHIISDSINFIFKIISYSYHIVISHNYHICIQIFINDTKYMMSIIVSPYFACRLCPVKLRSQQRPGAWCRPGRPPGLRRRQRRRRAGGGRRRGGGGVPGGGPGGARGTRRGRGEWWRGAEDVEGPEILGDFGVELKIWEKQ